MKKIILHETNFDEKMYWDTPIENENDLLDLNGVDLFDQNGYHLTKIEQLFGEVNGYPLKERRHETVLRQDWMEMINAISHSHFNHCDLFERKGYSGEALKQLEKMSSKNPFLWKLIKMKPKYGIDVSIDYVDEDGNVFEVFHYEWDSFSYESVVSKKRQIEDFVIDKDWDKIAKELLERKSEWYDLEFFEQSKWRTDYFGLSPEKFKQVIWSE